MEQTAIHPGAAARSATDLLNQLRQPVLVGLSKTLRRCLAGTIDDLLEKLLKETSWEQRQAIDDALDLLRNGREGIELKFDRACAESWADKTRNSDVAASGKPSAAPAALALVDDSAMGDQLTVGRIAARSRRRMDEEQVDGMRARFGFLMGRDWFADNEHPVAPDLVFESLRKSLAAFGQARVVSFLLEVFEPRMSAGLSTLYADLNQRLIRLGVLPEIRYQVSKPAQTMVRPANAAPAQAPAREPAAPVGPMQPAQYAGPFARVQAAGLQPGQPSAMMFPEAVTELVEQLDQRIHSAQGSAARYLSDSERFASAQLLQQPPSDRLLAALTTLQSAPPAAGHDAAAFACTAKAVSTAVAREHGSPLERLIIETVSLVFEHVYEDGEIADAIKQQLLRLQVAAFKAALIDPSFFARPDHPMRRLIDRIAQIGSDSDFDSTAGSPLVTDIAELVAWILGNFDRDLAIFESALGRLDDIVEAESGRRAARLARIAAAAQKAEVLARARNRIREELSAALGQDTPEFICRFLADSWTEVVSRIATGADFAPFDASRARRTVSQLLWSIGPKGPADIPALAAELPQLIADLSRGLSFIALSGAERELFFSELLAWHGATIDDAKRAGRSGTGNPPAAGALSPAGTSAAAPLPAPTPVRVSGLAEDQPACESVDLVDQVQASGEAAAFEDAVQELGLTNGTEVELEAPNGERKRFKVGWMSPSRSVFIFSRYPRDHWTAGRPMLNSLLAQGRLRLLGKSSGTSAAIESLKAR